MKFGIKKVQYIWQNISRKSKLIVLFGLCLIAIIGITGRYLIKNKPASFISTVQDNSDWQKYQPPGTEAPYFNLNPTTNSDYGIIPQETFVFTSTKAFNPEFIHQNLQSNVEYTLKVVNSTTFEIKITGTPKTDNVVTFNLSIAGKQTEDTTFNRNYNWAFQTQPKFSITSILPGDKKTNVPTNSGIEIVFNQDGYQDPTKFISISPKIEWIGKKHANTFSIVPQNPLLPKTIYTVTLKKGLDLESRSDPLSDDSTFSFQTEATSSNQSQPNLSLSKNFTQISTNEPVAVNAYSSNWNNDSTIQAKIFKFADSNQFIESRKKVDDLSSYWYQNNDNDLVVDTKNLLKVSEVNIKLQFQDNVSFLKLPEPLAAGYYLVQFWYDDSKHSEQLWLQSTDVSAYTSVGRRQTLVWANNVTTGTPIGQATISFNDSSVTHQTSQDGVSVFDTPLTLFEKSTHYLKVTSDAGQLLLPVTSLLGQDSNAQKDPSDYWSYIYHERSLYKPGDTIYFWGVIKDRASGQSPVNVVASITNGYQDYGSKKNTALTSVNIVPDGDGSFIGSLSLKDIPNGYNQINLNVDNQVITSSGFNITEYQKPELKIEVTSDKIAMFTGEKAEFSAKVSFYDGTPAKNIPLDIYQEFNNQTTQVKTDKNGQIKYTYVPVYKNDNSNYTYTYPHYESITIKSNLVNNDNLAGYGSVLVYGEKLSLTSNSKQDSNTAHISAQVNKVVLDNLNQKKSNVTKGDPTPNQPVKLVITKTWWDKVENGTYYDFIEKVTRKSYQYNEHREKITETNLSTDQSGQVNYQFTMEEGKSYNAAFSLVDQDGHPVGSNQYLYYYQGSQSNTDDKYTSPKLVLDQKENIFSIGDTVSLSIKYKDVDYPSNPNNKFLYILSQAGRQDYFVQDLSKFNFEFSQKNIPNVNASAIIFTGKYYQIATPDINGDNYYYWHDDNDTYFSSLPLNYRSDDSKLNLTISADKEKYAPGDMAKVTVNVKKGDQSLANTQVNLVLVDQAMEAIGGVIKPNLLSQIYSSVSNQIYYNYFSHKPISYQPPAAEKGGGGGDDRQVFKDTPFFGQSKTNDDGIASFNFQLPDNITTWIIYSQSINSQLDGGQSESTLVTTKEFFVTSNYPLEYLTRDTAYVSGNGFGKNISPNQNISYEVNVTDGGDKGIVNLTGQGKSSLDTQFRLPSVPAGDYKVSLRGTLDGNSDGLKLPFKVIDSRLNVLSNQKNELNKGQSISSLSLPGINDSAPVKLVISDIGYGKYYYQLLNYCYNYSNRLEKNIAQYKANKIIKARFDEDYCRVSISDLSRYQNSDGGLSQVAWGSSVLETTVWSIFVDPTPFDKPKLISYFENQLLNTEINSTQRIYALWGLSLLGKPKISQLNSLSKTATSFEDKAIIGIALATQGDIEDSKAIYQDILANFAYMNKPYFRIQAKADSYISDTSLALLLGNLVDNSLNQGYYSYLTNFSNQTEDVVLDLSRIVYLDTVLAVLPKTDSQVTLTQGGVKQTIDLSKGRKKVITLPGNKLKTTSISVDSGKAEINALYSLSSQSFAEVKKDERLSISRQITPVGSQESTIRPGDIVAIKIDFNLSTKAPYDCYTITDYLPSGLTAINNPALYGLFQMGWVYEKAKNVMQSSFCNSNWWRLHGDRNIVYYARAAAIGTYIAEPAVLQSQLDLSILQSTPENSIKIEALK